jgi:hypothetical protein
MQKLESRSFGLETRPFGFSSQFTYRSDNGLNFQNEITDLYFNLAFAHVGGELS